MHLLEHLKDRARHLHRTAHSNTEASLLRLRRHPELRALDADNAKTLLKRRHCLAILAMECGFDGWSHLTRVLGGQTDGDFGTSLHRSDCVAYSNVWFAAYDQARTVWAEHGGYLLPYKRQFLLADRYYVAALGLDPDHSDWGLMGRDWVRPLDIEARSRLYAVLILARLNGTRPRPLEQQSA